MGRKTLVAAVVSLAVLYTLATPRFGVLGAWGSVPRLGTIEQTTQTNGLDRIFVAPFRALGKLFGGGKKRKPISKITEKDISKFESSQVSRVNDAQTPPVTKPSSESLEVDHLEKGRELLNAGRLNEAISELTLAASINPKSGEAQTLLGVAYDRKGFGRLAREAFQTALHDPADQAMRLNNLGFLCYRQGDFDEAIKYLKRAAKLSPSDTRIWNNLTLAQLAAEKFDDAFKSSTHVIGEFDSRLKIAARLESRGYLKQAIKQLEKARAVQPRSTDVLSRLASLYFGTGQSEKAQTTRQTLVTLQSVAAAPGQK